MRSNVCYLGLTPELLTPELTVAGVIAAANCASAVATAMNQVERLLLNELWEWQGSRKK